MAPEISEEYLYTIGLVFMLICDRVHDPSRHQADSLRCDPQIRYNYAGRLYLLFGDLLVYWCALQRALLCAQKGSNAPKGRRGGEIYFLNIWDTFMQKMFVFSKKPILQIQEDSLLGIHLITVWTHRDQSVVFGELKGSVLVVTLVIDDFSSKLPVWDC